MSKQYDWAPLVRQLSLISLTASGGGLACSMIYRETFLAVCCTGLIALNLTLLLPLTDADRKTGGGK